MKSLRVRFFIITALLVTFAITQSLLFETVALADEKPETCEAKPYVVKIHADWCGRCRATQQTWAKIVTDLADEATVVKLDVSDRVAYEESVAEADRLGISKFFQDYRRRTGVIAILDCNTREPLVVFGGERDFDKYRDAVQKASQPS